MEENGKEQAVRSIQKAELLEKQEQQEMILYDRMDALSDEEKRRAVYVTAAVFGLGEERAEYVSQSEVPYMKTIFRALLEGIPLNLLKQMEAESGTERAFQAAVLQESCRRFSNVEPMAQQVKELHTKVQKALEDYEDAKNGYLAELLSTGRKERETQDKIIGMQEKKIQELEGQCQRLTTELARFGNLPAPVVPTVGTAEKKSGCRKWGWLRNGRKKQDEMEVFIGRYLDSREYSQEQKEFFLTCMEEKSMRTENRCGNAGGLLYFISLHENSGGSPDWFENFPV
jgi:hypothetical protein